MSHASRTLRVEPLEVGSRRAVVTTFLAVVLISGLLFFADWALRAESFPVHNVRFEGPFKHVERAELEAAVLAQVRTNFFLVDLGAIKHRVEALPWVQRASVRRAWPWDVHVRFSEQHLVGRWGEQAFVNDLGEVVQVSPPTSSPVLAELHGPTGTSAQVLAQFNQLRIPIAKAGLELVRLEMTPRHSWVATLANGTVINVDRYKTVEKLDRFLRVQHEVLARSAQAPQRVDLRYSNGFAVQWGTRRGTSAPSTGRSHESTVGQTAKEANKG